MRLRSLARLDCRDGPIYSWDTTPEDLRAAIEEILEGEVTYLDNEGSVDLADSGSSYRDGGTAIAVYGTRLLKTMWSLLTYTAATVRSTSWAELHYSSGVEPGGRRQHPMGLV